MTTAVARAGAAVLAGLALLVGAVGCGASNDDTSTAVVATATPSMDGDVQVFKVVGLRNLTYSASTLAARPGTIRVEFSVEEGSASHNFVIPEIADARTDILGSGESQTITFTVTQPGDYSILCTLHPNMTAVLRVS
ncbi:MAG: cupredoxin domain-containing protein [Frankia sp.]|nr:cupredoxin domain-containing protein [Frankia sp.]